MSLLLIIGPSGSGKSTLLRRLVEYGHIRVVPTWTTRPGRGDETDDIEHVYTSDEQFDTQKFMAVVKPFGLPYRYGMPFFKETKGDITVIMVRAPQVAEFKLGFPDAKVYQIEAPYALASERLSRRTVTNESNEIRVEDYAKERALGRTLADRVFINDQTPEILDKQIIASIHTDFSAIFG